MRLPRRPRYADVAATLALAVALGGTAYAVTELPANSVGTVQIKPDAVTASRIQAQAVTASELAPGSVTGADVKNESITLSDVLGANVTGKLSIHVQVNDCQSITMNTPGVKEGQAVLFGFSGGVDLPAALVSPPAEILSDGKVRVRFCNVGFDNDLEVTDIPFRVVTFG